MEEDAGPGRSREDQGTVVGRSGSAGGPGTPPPATRGRGCKVQCWLIITLED